MSENSANQRPGQLLARLNKPTTGPIIVDFDETLWLRNSTEEYLAAMRPAWLAGLLLYLIETGVRVCCKVFGRLPGTRSATWVTALRNPGVVDGLRVNIATACLPWHKRFWSHNAPALGEHWVNRPLLDALTHQHASGVPVVVNSMGFERVVAPLLRGVLGEIDWPLIASRGLNDRMRSKCERLHEAPEFKGHQLEQSMVITDSERDQDLLDACAEPWLLYWPEASYQRAHSGTHLPLYYTHNIKHPGKQFLRNAVLQDDFAFWLLALPWTGLWPLQAMAAGLLLLSFWSVYENGYRENDVLGEAREDQPVLSDAYTATPHRHDTRAAWLWALLFAAAGVALLDFAGSPMPEVLTDQAAQIGVFPVLLVAWTSLLLATRVVFWAFNRLGKRQRTILFPLLQMARNFALAVVAALSVPGLLLLTAHTVARCLPYFIYRMARTQNWPKIPVATLRLAILLVALPIWALQVSPDDLPIGPVAAILVWCLIRARNDIKDLRVLFQRKG